MAISTAATIPAPSYKMRGSKAINRLGRFVLENNFLEYLVLFDMMVPSLLDRMQLFAMMKNFAVFTYQE